MRLCEHLTPLLGHQSRKNLFMRLCEERSDAAISWQPTPGQGDCFAVLAKTHEASFFIL
jgi:hypothetical protein